MTLIDSNINLWNNYNNKNMDYEVLYFLKMVFAFGFTYYTYYKTK